MPPVHRPSASAEHDALGRWHQEGGQLIDAAGAGRVEGIGEASSDVFGSLHGLGALLARSEAAPRCFTRQAWRFAVGRDAPEGDCAIERLSQELVAADFSVQALLVALVSSPEFAARR